MNLGQVYTKPLVADYMVSLFSKKDGARYLDPCFGRGAFIYSVLKNTNCLIEGVEIDDDSFKQFKNPDIKRCKVWKGDFFEIEGEYDGIIMNPPYVRQEEIDEMESIGITKRKLQSACNLTPISGKANLYMYFVLRAILLLKNEGELIAIFPNSWVNTPVGQQFYEQIIHYGCVKEFINVEGESFEGSPMVDVCILKFVKNGIGTTVYKSMYIGFDFYVIEEESKQERSVHKNLVKLKSFASVRRGITTGANAYFVNPFLFTQEHIVSILSSPKHIKGYTTKLCQKDKLLAIKHNDILSEEEQTYLFNCSKAILEKGNPLTLKKMIDNNLPWYYIAIPDAAQIIFSYIVRSKMKFVLNEDKLNVRDNFYMINSSYEPYLLFALLNNYYVYSQLERCGKSYGKGLLKLQKYDIDGIMVPSPINITAEERKELVSLAKSLVESSNDSIIDEISMLLSHYYGIGNEKTEYYKLKTKRLSIYE